MEILRATSPDGKLDAVLVAEDCGGAAGSVDYDVYIAVKGKKSFENNERVFTAVRLHGEKLRWINSQLLEIEFDQAYIIESKEFVQHSQDDKTIRQIEIRKRQNERFSNRTR